MSRLLLAALTVLALQLSCLVPECLAAPVWQSLGPYGGSVFALAIDPGNTQTVYAGSYGGVFKSSNGGALWTPANAGITSSYAQALAIDPSNSQTLFVGTMGGGVFKSLDAGASWTPASSGLTDKNLTSIVIDPGNGQTVYAGTQAGGVFTSLDGGSTWTATSNGLTNLAVSALAVDPVHRQTLYAGSNGGGVFKSIDGGGSWAPVNSGVTTLSVTSLAIDRNDSQTVYAATYGGGLFKTGNGGTAWNPANGGLGSYGAFAVAIDPGNSQTVYVATQGDGVLKSSDGGASWNATNAGLPYLDARALAIDPVNGRTVYFGTYGQGLYKSASGGASWSVANTGITNTNVEALAVDPTSTKTVYAGAYNGLYKSGDGGGTWSAVNTQLSNAAAIVVDPVNGQTLYAGVYGGPLKSGDGGATWKAANSGIPATGVYALAVDPVNRQTVYAGTQVGLFKSGDGGGSWTESDKGITSSFVLALAIDPGNSQTLYAGTQSGGVFKSSDGGANWSAANTGIAGSYVTRLAVDPGNGATVYAVVTGQLYKSSDGGLTWSGTGIAATALALGPANSQTVYAGALGGGVAKSADSGASWTVLSAGMTGIAPGCLVVDPGDGQTVYAGAWAHGAFKLTATSAPAITSQASASFGAGAPGSYTLTATGSPRPAFSMTGTLPAGVTFDPGTGVLGGVPALGSAGSYSLLFSASNGLPPDATRGVVLTVLPALPLAATIVSPVGGSKLAVLPSISGTASGVGLARVEVQVGDGVYFLQADGSFGTAPAWLPAAGAASWTLDTSSARWVDGITYTVQARAWTASAASQPVQASVRMLAASNKGYTQISLNFTPGNLKSGDATVASGQITRLPDDGSSLSGLPLNLIVTPPSTAANPTPAPVIIPLATGGSGSYSSGALSQFVTPGVYLAQVRFDGSSTLAASFTVPQPLYVNIQSGYAIVVSGKAPDNSLLAQHNASTDAIVAALKKRGFLDANIDYLKSDANNAVTPQQIHDAITIWAKGKLSAAPAPLYLVMIDHGQSNGFVLGNLTLTPDLLKGYLDDLETGNPDLIASGALTDFNRFIFIGSCYSGGFVGKLSKPGRVVITSAAANEESLAGVNVFGISTAALYGGEFFFDTLFSFLGRGDTVKDAFNEAKSAVSIRDPRSVPLGLHSGSYDTLAQHPLLDDNGDGNPSYILSGNGDGNRVAALTLGEGVRVNSLGNPADIARVTPTDFLSGSVSGRQLWLTANINSRVGRAWAEIRQPGVQNSGAPSSGQFVPALDLIPLVYDGSNWVGDYGGFSAPGSYDIYYYTVDNQTGEVSPAAHSRVYKLLDGNAPPAAFDLQSPADGATTPPMIPLVWQESSDPDGLSYTLLVASDPGFHSVVYREEGIAEADSYLAPGALQDPASATGGYYCQSSPCYWKVQAIDRYGAVTESPGRSFSVAQTGGLPGIVKGYLRSGSGMPLAGVRIGIGSSADPVSYLASTLSNGAFIVAAAPGSYTVSASPSGFNALASSITVDAGLVSSANFTVQTSLAGDCDGNGVVTISEVQGAINMLLGLSPVESCVDLSGSGTVGLPDVQKVINSFLGL